MATDGENEDELFVVPERGSVDELLDHGVGHSELDAMRHSTAHVMAEAVLDLFPGTRLGIGPAIQMAGPAVLLGYALAGIIAFLIMRLIRGRRPAMAGGPAMFEAAQGGPAAGMAGGSAALLHRPSMRLTTTR